MRERDGRCLSCMDGLTNRRRERESKTGCWPVGGGEWPTTRGDVRPGEARRAEEPRPAQPHTQTPG